jgi:hypothetical protein
MEYIAILYCNLHAACMIQANTIVYLNQAKKRTLLDEVQLKEYLKLICDIPDTHFLIHTTKVGMLEGYVTIQGKTAAVANEKMAVLYYQLLLISRNVITKDCLFVYNVPKDLPSLERG